MKGSLGMNIFGVFFPQYFLMILFYMVVHQLLTVFNTFAIQNLERYNRLRLVHWAEDVTSYIHIIIQDRLLVASQ